MIVIQKYFTRGRGASRTVVFKVSVTFDTIFTLLNILILSLLFAAVYMGVDP